MRCGAVRCGAVRCGAHHASVDEDERGVGTRRRVEEDVAGVEVGVHQVVHEQHLEVQVLAARHHEVRHVPWQRGAAAAAPHDLVDGVGRHELSGLEALEEHGVTA